MMRKIGVIVLALAASGAPAWSQQEVNERRPAAPGARVRISNISGSVVVTGWSREEVEITGTLGKATEGLEIAGDREEIVIKVTYPERSRKDESGESDLTIHVPIGCRLSVDTVSARIDLSAFDGEADLKSVSGSIEVKGTPRELDLTSVSGTMNVTADEPLPGGEFETVSGDIHVEADLGGGGRFKFETVSGGVILRLPASVSADLDISSFSGSIENDFGQTPRRKDPDLPSKDLRFTLGSGSARVSVETLSGRIRIEKV